MPSQPSVLGCFNASPLWVLESTSFSACSWRKAIDYAPSKALLLEMAQQWVKMAEFAR